MSDELISCQQPDGHKHQFVRHSAGEYVTDDVRKVESMVGSLALDSTPPNVKVLPSCTSTYELNK